jgi:hypothetical protein
MEARRRTTRVGTEQFVSPEYRAGTIRLSLEIQANAEDLQRLRMGPLNLDHSAARVPITAAVVVNCALAGWITQRVVAGMNCFANATCVTRRRSDCEGQRTETPRECDEQRESGDEPVHAGQKGICSLSTYADRGKRSAGVPNQLFEVR